VRRAISGERLGDLGRAGALREDSEGREVITANYHCKIEELARVQPLQCQVFRRCGTRAHSWIGEAYGHPAISRRIIRLAAPIWRRSSKQFRPGPIYCVNQQFKELSEFRMLLEPRPAVNRACYFG